MPDKPLTVLTYAASASLAAVALVYLFNPSYLFDAVVPGGAAAVMAGDPRLRGGRGRAVGLTNPANDCFINSVLQALASLGALELYLAREIASRDADEQDENTGEGKIYGYRSPEELKEEEEDEEDEEEEEDTGKAVITGKRKREVRKATTTAAAAVGASGVPGKGLDAEWRAQAAERKTRSLLAAEVTRGLKAMLDQLNDRSTEGAQRTRVITAAPFVAALERAFATRVNRNQQDAQELLQVVAERMAEEFAAGKAARERARKRGVHVPDPLVLLAQQRAKEKEEKEGKENADGEKAAAEQEEQVTEQADPDNALAIQVPEQQEDRKDQHTPATASAPTTTTTVPTTQLNGESIPTQDLSNQTATASPPAHLNSLLEDEGFPLQGQTTHQIECQHCGFIPSSTPTDFLMLTLPVPPTRSSTTLDSCLDAFSKPEYIDDYKCDRCRLDHAIQLFSTELSRSSTSSERADQLKRDIPLLQAALEKDPESPPASIKLPDSKLAPARRIARSVKITAFPRVLVVHLSRSAFDPGAESSKNTAKVVFPEHLALGSLADRRKYRLLGMVTHKGTHDSGHYETFRRQHAYEISLADLADEEGDLPAGSKAVPGAGGGNATATASTSVSAAGSPAAPEVRNSISPSDGSEPETDGVDAKGNRRGSGAETPVPSSVALATSSSQQQQPQASRRPISRRRNPFSRHSREHSRSSHRPSASVSASTPDPVSEAPPTETPHSPDTSATSAATTTATNLTTATTTHTSSPTLPSSNSNPSLDVPRPSIDALISTNAQAHAQAQSQPMERASSRQRIRDKMEEAKERKREKRLRRLVARENARWWRISDDRVRECRSNEVLGFMKEVYLLFYEME